ncbi:hypothetical protein ABPG72_016438 [Tetrahymena utriculariae]
MSNSDLRTLWVGDIEAWMNEQFIESVFNKVGKVVSVKLIRTKETSLPAGYCFVEFQTHEQAERILMNYNQQLIPGTPNTFRMNWGKNPTNTGIIKQPTTQANNGYANPQYGVIQQPVIQMPPIQEFSIYVGELELGINDQQLTEHFRSKYPSVINSKIITEPTSKMSKGYGFVKFSIPIEGQRAIHEMNGSLFKGKFIKVSQAVSRQQQQAQAQATGTSGFPQPAYGTATGAVDYNGNSGYYQWQPSQDSYYQQFSQQQVYASTQNQQYYPYYTPAYYSQNGHYGADPSQLYGQPAQTSNMYQFTTTASSQNPQGQTQQYSQQYAQQGQIPQVPSATAATNPATIQQQQYYNQTAQTSQAQSSQQAASTHDKYSQINYQSQQSSASNAHYSQQQQYSNQQQQQQVQSQASSQSQTAQQQQHSNQQQLNQSEKKSETNSIPAPSAKEQSFFQKPSSDFIGYQTEYVSMTGELEFILKHNIC